MKRKSDITTMTITEKEWNRPPTKGDIRRAEKLLTDFNIVIAIPNFTSYKVLQAWTKQQISTVFN